MHGDFQKGIKVFPYFKKVHKVNISHMSINPSCMANILFSSNQLIAGDFGIPLAFFALGYKQCCDLLDHYKDVSHIELLSFEDRIL